MKKALTTSVLILTVYLVTNLIVPLTLKGNMIFLADTFLWLIVILTTLLFAKLYQTNLRKTDKTVIQIAAIIAIFQIFLLLFTSFFMGFGENAVTWTTTALTFYFPFLITPFIAMELSRAFLTTKISRRKPTLTLLLISLFYTLLLTTIPTYTSLTTPLAISEFLIKTFIPTLAINLLATYFAHLGGFLANLTYMAIPAFFTWFSPILPNPPWAAQSILTVIAATIGFLVLDQAVKPLPTKRIHRTLIKQKSQLPYWTAIALIGLIAVWSSTGLLGFTPTIIASGSMQPTMDAGDIAVVAKVPTDTIKPGDIIQYVTPDAMIIHRVIDTTGSKGSKVFVTKGDANTQPDDPILQSQVLGKVLFTIPKLGWVSVYLKTAFVGIISFFLNNMAVAYATLGIIVAGSLFGFHRYRNQPLRKLRRRIGR